MVYLDIQVGTSFMCETKFRSLKVIIFGWIKVNFVSKNGKNYDSDHVHSFEYFLVTANFSLL